MEGLSRKQERFVIEYVQDLNATQAAKRAGYSEKTADAIGAENLRKPKIIAAVAKAQEARTIRTEITADRVLKELARIGLSDPRKLFDEDGGIKPPKDWDDDVAASIASIKMVERPSGKKDKDGNPIMERTYDVKVWDKNAALDKIAKHFGMFIERQEITVTHRIAQMSDEELDQEIQRELAGAATQH